MTTFETLYWNSFTDSELQRIVNDNGQLLAYQMKALNELNKRTINNKIK